MYLYMFCISRFLPILKNKIILINKKPCILELHFRIKTVSIEIEEYLVFQYKLLENPIFYNSKRIQIISLEIEKYPVVLPKSSDGELAKLSIVFGTD